MKITVKKTIATALILFIVLLLFGGCINNSTFHTHDYKLKSNETEHFMECSCGEVKDRTEHAFEWVVDSEPTYTTPGYKHKECGTCGYKTEENTVIGNVLDVPGVEPTPITSKSFVNYDDLKSFYNENREKINTAFLSINAVSDSERGIYIVNEQRELVKYTFEYDRESDGHYINPYIVTRFSVYSTELGTDTNVELDIPYHSFTLEFISKGCNQEITDLRFEFADWTDPGSIWERIVYVYDGSELIGGVYLSFSLEISDDWFADYLRSNFVVIN